VDRIWGNFRMLPNSKTFSDQSNRQLEIRKNELLSTYLRKTSYYVQLQVWLYRMKKKQYPRLHYFFRVLQDKINFEVSKLKTKLK
jgi:hypothetical protein